MKRWIFLASALLAFTLAGDRSGTGAAGSASNAGLAPGTVIDASNVQGFTQYLNPAMFFAVSHGLKIKVTPPDRVDWPQLYQQATEQHAAQVSLDQTDSLQNYVAGIPFPSIEDRDPKAGVKIAYNWRWGPFIPDEVTFSNLASRTYSFSAADPLSFRLDPTRDDFRNELTCDRAIVMRRAHRLDSATQGGDDGGDAGVQWEERGDECGPEQGKFIALLYSDANRQPDSYVFLEATRRWRRVALPLVPNQSCSYSCSQLLLEYMPPPAGLYSWKLADKRTMLGCLHGAAFDANGTRFGQISCEPRVVDVIDMIPRDQKSDLLPARLYLDAETYLYLGGEVFRDQNPDLSWAIWTKGNGNESSSAKGLVLADDLYVPDDHASTFMWLDMSQRQNFEDNISENLFNPKAAQ